MNRRLKAIRALIPDGRGVIDVGTDHGYLPVQLFHDRYPGKIFASDIRRGPLSAAQKTAESAGALEAITFFLCDGLDACPPDKIDTIVIAGLGGDTICGILDRAEWCLSHEYLLLLQPMTKAEVLRYWLVNNGFELLNEDLESDAGAIYQITAARFCGENMRLSDAELFLGPFDLVRNNALFPDFLQQQRSRIRTRINGMQAGAQKDSPFYFLMRHILDEMTEMEERLHDDRS